MFMDWSHSIPLLVSLSLSYFKENERQIEINFCDLYHTTNAVNELGYNPQYSFKASVIDYTTNTTKTPNFCAIKSSSLILMCFCSSWFPQVFLKWAQGG